MIFGISYAEWIGYIVVVVLVIVFGLPNAWVKRLEKYYSSDHLHRAVSPDEVNAVILRDSDGNERALESGERERIIDLFNAAKPVQKIESLANTQQGPLLRMVRTDGNSLVIAPYRNDFVVSCFDAKKNDRPITYWAKQDALTEFLHRGAGND
ncbi:MULTISPECIES: hypothetical protein [Aneurinibacillus]|uniref:Uncharacterized protein n=1 Tax=Aneurinibacillus thermoaerophilus TaxID=143495 RepID=A0A1G7XD62_ANETH|nr:MULTISPECIES: hypothetical protein [Aneurinibacillus]AMA73321.1 hypothetical protein ACH33_10960 [Aneurinibacillus sp. XH2]MED0677160.1 hypothetical protein [Aneurinibacillus thermoaerophilus]MED0736226.1 hypothetical protein [Aneurinibacillus thermoaerophilus]MED0758577.1 hypothetical protein [Aneurinibacillus thermoaerophilus]MED0760471.1 hypothetical protein [Aneurinibacillus thermoaerophilus]